MDTVVKPKIHFVQNFKCKRCRRRINYKPVNSLCQPCRNYLKAKGLMLQNKTIVHQPNGGQLTIKNHKLANRAVRFKCKCKVLVTAKVLSKTVRCYKCGHLYNITLISGFGRLMARVSVYNPNVSFPSLKNETVGIYELIKREA